MELAELLGIKPGVTALIGGGGKTTAMYRLARELRGTVICCTSARILPPSRTAPGRPFCWWVPPGSGGPSGRRFTGRSGTAPCQGPPPVSG